MSGQPLVSIMVPCYNSESTLAETLASALKQTHRNLRVIVIDNASRDGTGRIASEFARKDARLRVARFERYLECPDNWTRCLELAEGDYSCLLSADDVYCEDILEKEVAALQTHPEAGGVLTNSFVIDDEGRVIGRRRLPEEIFRRHGGLLRFPEALSLVFKYASFFMTPSFMARTPLFRGLGSFDARAPRATDVDAFLRFLKKDPILFLAEPLIYNRISRHGYSGPALKNRTTPSDLFMVLDRHIQDAPPLSREDRDNYDYLRFKDHVRCAVNAILQGDRAAARSMASAVFSPAWKCCTRRPGRPLIYAVGLACWALSFLPLPDFFKAALFKVRFEYKRP